MSFLGQSAVTPIGVQAKTPKNDNFFAYETAQMQHLQANKAP
jgi:hypothetical protein